MLTRLWIGIENIGVWRYFKRYIGNVSTPAEGIPKELTEHYLSKGYSRNDRVGKSYLEYQYEDVLRGKKKEMKYTTDKSGKVTSSEVLNPGARGQD